MCQHVCEVCGNEYDARFATAMCCPHCGAGQSGQGAAVPPDPGRLHRLVNLERGRPPVERALSRLEQELASGRLQGVRVLTLIHGYGSSGRGGAIREAVRARLSFLRQTGRIEAVIFGEDFESRTGRGRQLLRRCPFLAAHADLNRKNPGITVVLLAPGSRRG